MIIHDFLTTKEKCPFCEEELRIFVESPGYAVESKIENNILRMESRYINVSVHILDNEVITLPETQKVNFNFTISRDCPLHSQEYQNNGCVFEHRISYSITPRFNYLLVTRHVEKIEFDKYSLIFHPESKLVFGATENTAFNVPYFNPNNLTIEQIKNKISTYLIFS